MIFNFLLVNYEKIKQGVIMRPINRENMNFLIITFSIIILILSIFCCDEERSKAHKVDHRYDYFTNSDSCDSCHDIKTLCNQGCHHKTLTKYKPHVTENCSDCHAAIRHEDCNSCHYKKHPRCNLCHAKKGVE